MIRKLTVNLIQESIMANNTPFLQEPDTEIKQKVVVSKDYDGDVTITVNGLLTDAETIDIVCPGTAGADDSPSYSDGTRLQITTTNSWVRIQGNTTFKVVKNATTNMVGFHVA